MKTGQARTSHLTVIRDIRDGRPRANPAPLSPRAEALCLVVGMSAVCAFAAVGVLHLYDALSAGWHVAGSIAAVAVVAFVIAWQGTRTS